MVNVVFNVAKGPIAYLATLPATDADIIPHTKHDFVVTPSGVDITAQVASTGWYLAS